MKIQIHAKWDMTWPIQFYKNTKTGNLPIKVKIRKISLKLHSNTCGLDEVTEPDYHSTRCSITTKTNTDSISNTYTLRLICRFIWQLCLINHIMADVNQPWWDVENTAITWIQSKQLIYFTSSNRHILFFQSRTNWIFWWKIFSTT